MRKYLLSLLCLVAVIFVLQPKQNNTDLQEWLRTNPAARATLQLPNTSSINDTTNDTTEEQSSQDGYVFSLPIGESDIESALPERALNSNNSSNTTEVDLNSSTESASNTIIKAPTDLTILSNSTDITEQNSSSSYLLLKFFNKSNLITALILFTASFLQGASGFAFAVLMMPLLVWSGFDLAEASMFTAVSALFITSFMVYQLRQHVKWRVLLPTMFLRIGTMAVGVFLLAILTTLDRVLVRQILGVLLLIIVAIQVLTRRKNQSQTQANLAPHWSWLAFGSGGLFGGMVGFGGPAVALWVMAQNWSSKASRSFLTASYWSILPIQIILLLSTFGEPMAGTGIRALYFLPIVLIGVFLGIGVGNRFDKNRLRYLVQGLLLVTGLVSLLAPYIGLS